MYADEERCREYQRKWHKRFRDKVASERPPKVPKPVRNSESKQNWRRYVKKHPPKCERCEIIIGEGQLEEQFYQFRGKKLCKQCYEELVGKEV